ncbi:Alpha/Beta hydrolase protein [Hyaloraphidium curvatum]|nr:Alpha/Beta hydrolase protein [Hyaloraphidium curvatum]
MTGAGDDESPAADLPAISMQDEEDRWPQRSARDSQGTLVAGPEEEGAVRRGNAPRWATPPPVFGAPPPLSPRLLQTPAEMPRARPGSGEHRRKRSLSTLLHVTSPFLDDVEDRLLDLQWRAEEVVREVSVVARLAGRLAGMLGFARLWLGQLFALLAFTFFLLPGFLAVMVEYYRSPRVRRGVRYGARERNYADIYLPPPGVAPPNAVPGSPNRGYPIAVFLTGGAWIIGYRAWGALLGLSLSGRGIVVVVPDYRNYPQGRCGEMLRDVTRAVEWVAAEAGSLGGDPANLHLVGQSAGAHLSACSLLDQLARHLPPDVQATLKHDPLYHISRSPVPDDREEFLSPAETYPSYPPPRSYIGISGPYNVPLHGLKFLEKGLNRRIVLDIFHGDLRGYSPSHRALAIGRAVRSRRHGQTLASLAAQDKDLEAWTGIPVLLLHGTADKSVASSSSTQFAGALASIFSNVACKLYPGKTHTDPIIEGPFSGTDEMGDDVFDWIARDDVAGAKWVAGGPNGADGGKGKRGEGTMGGEVEGRRVPEFLVRWARWWNPF